MVDFLERLAHVRVILHGDGEPAIRSLFTQVQKRRAQPTETRYTPKFSGQSIGRLAALQGLLQGQARALKMDVEERSQTLLKVRHPLYAWCVRHAAWVMNRFRIMADGCTPFQHLHGVPFHGVLVRFAEAIMFMHAHKEGQMTRHIRRAKAETLWQHGVMLGKTEKSEEFLVGTLQGLYKSRSVRRLCAERQWNSMAEELKVVPWAPEWGQPMSGRIVRRMADVPPFEVESAEPMGEQDVISRRVRARSPTPVKNVEGPGFMRGSTRVRFEEPAIEAGGQPAEEGGQPTQQMSTETGGEPGSASGQLAGGSTGGAPVPSGGAPVTAEMEVEGRGVVRQGAELDGGDVKRYRTVGMLQTMDEDNSDDMELLEFDLDAESMEDQNAGPTDVEERNQARYKGFMLELQRLEDFKAFTAVARASTKGHRIISTRWVNKWKLDNGQWVFRARFVAKDFANYPTDEYFAPTTSSTTSRILDVYAVKKGHFHFELDASNAFLHTPCAEDEVIYIEPPDQWLQMHAESLKASVGLDCVWRMHKMINGLRRGPQAWLEWASRVLHDLGFAQCLECPCFYQRALNTKQQILLELHMDDVHGVCAERSSCHKLVEELASQIMIKLEGPFGPGDSFTHLKRTREIFEDKIIIRPSPRYADEVIRELGLDQGKAVTTPRAEMAPKQLRDLRALPPLSQAQVKQHRAMVGKLLYLSLDRHDICYAVKELTKCLKQPDHVSWSHLKRVARYLLATRNAHIVLHRGTGMTDQLTAYSDADLGADAATRKSTTGYAVMWKFRLVLRSDSSAALGVARRLGQGPIKHLDTRAMWIQSLTRQGRLEMEKVEGKYNIADIGTKTLGAPRLRELCLLMGLCLASQLHKVEAKLGSEHVCLASQLHEMEHSWHVEWISFCAGLLGGATLCCIVGVVFYLFRWHESDENGSEESASDKNESDENGSEESDTDKNESDENGSHKSDSDKKEVDTIVNETIVNETIVNETIVNETIVNETIGNETIVNETSENERSWERDPVDVPCRGRVRTTRTATDGTLWIAPRSGRRVHSDRTCCGLRGAFSVEELPYSLCKLCLGEA
eukprot:737254-Amphidinium_carterae.1